MSSRLKPQNLEPCRSQFIVTRRVKYRSMKKGATSSSRRRNMSSSNRMQAFKEVYWKGTEMKHNHEQHSCSCEHTAVKHCNTCKVIHCLDCNQEWSPRQSLTWATSYPLYPYYSGYRSNNLLTTGGALLQSSQNTGDAKSYGEDTVNYQSATTCGHGTGNKE